MKGLYSLLITIVYFCCTPSIPFTNYYSEKTLTKSQMIACNSALENIKTKNFINWTGLPKGCDWTSLVGDLPTDWEQVPERSLGSNFLSAKILSVNLKGYIRASLSFIKGTPILFEAMGPKLPISISELIKELGTPTAKLNWDFGTLPCPDSEYIYPDKGITLFLSSDKTRIFHIGLYASTSLDNYLQNIRPNLGKKRLPIR